MKLSRPGFPAFRLITVISFVLACAVFFGYLWAQAGGTMPFFGKNRPYSISVDVPNIRNLVPFSDVQIAGVGVGKVESITRAGDKLRLELALDDVAAPVHEGAKIRVTEKSLAGQYYVEIVDGKGRPLPSGSHLPDSAVLPTVTLRDVLISLDAKTKESLRGVIHSLGAATAGRAEDISALLEGLGDLGRSGDTAVDAIAAQSEDLKALARELEAVFQALDTSEGQIVQVVNDVNRLTAATAGQREAVAATMRLLPGLLDSAQTAAGELTDLSSVLAPVAADLRRAAPDLRQALVQLPATTADLRALLPSLNAVLEQAPATLDRVPPVGADVRALIPHTREFLRDLNPALRYLKPYGLDIAQILGFGAAFHHYSSDGKAYVNVRPLQNPHALRPNPVPLPTNTPLIQVNPYPGPGTLDNPQPFTGQFPRLERDPK